MITSIFRKSTPLNYSLVALLVFFFFFMYHFQDVKSIEWGLNTVKKSAILLILWATVFLSSFIAKKNGLTKDSSFTLFFYFLSILFFPTIYNNFEIVLSNLCVLLAFRRIIALQTLKDTSQKIFDASLLIFVASLFHFWCIVYLALVFFAVFLHAARDYRNWIIPYIAFFTTIILYLCFLLITNQNVDHVIQSMGIVHWQLDYFTSSYQNAALAVFASVALFFVVNMYGALNKKLLIVQTAFKKLGLFFFLSIFMYLISDHKSNDLLIFTFAPLSIMASSYIETAQLKLQKEFVAYTFIICALCLFFIQF